MRKILLGKSGVRVSAVIMGCWQAGRKDWAGISDSMSEKAVRAALDAGITAFDTAESYGNGHSERLLGRSLSGVRNRVTILSKVFANHLHRDAVIAACERSLKNLGTDRIDLYQVHWPSGSFGMKPVPAEETLSALDRLRRDGKILAAGLCNASAEESEVYAGHGLLDAVQWPYSLFFRRAETDIIPFVEKRGVAFLAYSPLAQGFLTGKFGQGHRFGPEDHRARNRLFAPDVFNNVIKVVECIREISRPLGISPAEAALAWVLSAQGVAAIAGARNAEQVEQNAGAARIVLSAADRLALSEAAGPVALLFMNEKLQWFPPERKPRKAPQGR
jgi:aryl-alcohol dehydrogenase-like predicted oxidoreductase